MYTYTYIICALRFWLQRGWLKQYLHLKEWHVHVHREFLGKFESTNLSRDSSYESRARLKGYGGPSQSSEHFMVILCVNCTLFDSTPLAYICKQSTVESVRWSFSELWTFHGDFMCQLFLVQQYSVSLLQILWFGQLQVCHHRLSMVSQKARHFRDFFQQGFDKQMTPG